MRLIILLGATACLCGAGGAIAGSCDADCKRAVEAGVHKCGQIYGSIQSASPLIKLGFDTCKNKVVESNGKYQPKAVKKICGTNSNGTICHGPGL